MNSTVLHLQRCVRKAIKSKVTGDKELFMLAPQSWRAEQRFIDCLHDITLPEPEVADPFY